VRWLLGMVQLLIRLVAPGGRVPEVLDAFRTVMRPAQQARGCVFAQVYNWVNDDRRREYVAAASHETGVAHWGTTDDWNDDRHVGD
jgi:hypothetical protein